MLFVKCVNHLIEKKKRNSENLERFLRPSGQTLGDIDWNDPSIIFEPLKQENVADVVHRIFLLR